MSRQVTSIKQRQSRYTQGGITDEFPKRLGWWERRILSTDESDITVEISRKAEARPDIIAYQIYGEAYFAWVVMQFNAIVDPVEELKAGDVIKLPTPRRLKSSMFNRAIVTNV